jgi:hypothetical protein
MLNLDQYSLSFLNPDQILICNTGHSGTYSVSLPAAYFECLIMRDQRDILLLKSCLDFFLRKKVIFATYSTSNLICHVYNVIGAVFPFPSGYFILHRLILHCFSGLAVAGATAIAEIQFADYIFPAFDQV